VHRLLHRLQREGLLTITAYGRGQLSDLTLTEAGRNAAQRWQHSSASAEVERT
jgi:DNA-binding PadR family transcriptional regulator